MFSTGSDLTAIGHSILNSSLLAPRVTRQWLKTTTNTGDLRMTVEMPWEILRNRVSTDGLSTSRIVDLYTKNGGIGAYYAQIALSPDHGFGCAVLTVGPPPTTGPDMRMATMQRLNGIVTDAILPAFKTSALEQAATKFAGTYVATRTNESESMRLCITAGDGELGLSVQNWTSGNVDMLKSFFASTSTGNPDSVTGEPSLRLYPMSLYDDGRVAFRGVFEHDGSVGVYSTDETLSFGPECAAWAAVSTLQYGNVGLDDFVFEVDKSGSATAVTARGVRTKLTLQGK